MNDPEITPNGRVQFFHNPPSHSHPHDNFPKQMQIPEYEVNIHTQQVHELPHAGLRQVLPVNQKFPINLLCININNYSISICT